MDIKDKEINGWINGLSEESRRSLVKRIRENNTPIETAKEVAVGYALNKTLGFRIEYEKEIYGKRPDWYVHQKGHMPDFVVEVLTKDTPAKEKNRELLMVNLLQELRNIPIGCVLFLHGSSRNLVDEETNKRIARDVRSWIDECNPSAGECIETSGFKIRFRSHLPEINHPSVNGPFFALWLDSGRFKDGVIKKERGLSRLIRRSIPVVIGCSARVFSGLDSEDWKDAMMGNNGLFTTTKSKISASIWVHGFSPKDWRIEAIHNPEDRILPRDTFQ